MQVWPAIDLRQGKCVRLRQGDFDRETVFNDDPLEVALRWQDQGAQELHLVDLDGAKSGEQTNRDAIRRIVQGTRCACQLGGGLRDESSVRQALQMGLKRVVLGSAAVESATWLERIIAEFPRRIWIGLDYRQGQVAIQGWTRTTNVTPMDLIARWSGLPIAGFICTGISRDGMLSGPDLAGLSELRGSTHQPLVASGGITSVQDIQALGELAVDGIIIGRALYEGHLLLPDALDAARTYTTRRWTSPDERHVDRVVENPRQPSHATNPTGPTRDTTSGAP